MAGFRDPRYHFPSTVDSGYAPKADTPNPSNQKINYPLTKYETTGAGGCSLRSYDKGNKGLGICIIEKSQGGSGYVIDHGNCYEQRNECTSYVGTKGESVNYGNGNSISSSGGHNTSCAGEHVKHSGGGGESSIASGGVQRHTGKDSTNSSQMHTIGGSLGFACGGTLGLAGREVNIKSAGNMSAGGSGTSSLSGQLDCSVGSQTGCMHMYGKGIAIGALLGDIAIDAGKSMNFTVQGRYVNRTTGDIYVKGAKIYLNSSSPPIPMSTDEIASTYGKSILPSVPDAIPVIKLS